MRLDGRALFQVSSDDSERARERARAIETRLERILETPSAIPPVQIESDGDNRLLSIAARPLLTITPDDARDNMLTTDALAAQWKNAIDAALQRAGNRRLSAWGRFGAETQASIETAFARLLESAIVIIPRLLAGFLVLLLFWALASLVRWSMRLLFHRVVSDLTVENLLKQIAYYSVWAIGLVVATSALGFDPQTLATALGLTGVALGFALKDILSNFVAGLLILALRSFEIGDQIVIGDTEGAVERITLRATQIRTYDGRAVLVPNAEVFTSRVTNNTESPIRRGAVEMPLGYASDLQRAVETLRTAAQGAGGVLAEPPTKVRVRELKQDDIMLEVQFWTDSRRSDFVSTLSNVRTAVVEAFKAAHIGLPDPDVRILVRKTQ
ncbi:MAG: mechanosensitive ion channel family protein [Gammaproteobacteria bacterium]